MFILACKCNSRGSVASRNILFIYQRDNTACNNETCICITGYKGNDCNMCEAGYFVSSSYYGENICEPGDNKVWIKKYQNYDENFI